MPVTVVERPVVQLAPVCGIDVGKVGTPSIVSTSEFAEGKYNGFINIVGNLIPKTPICIRE